MRQKKDTPSCAFCGCSQVDCLGQCKVTKKYFCNGRGRCSESHIIHYLKKTNQKELSIPSENNFHSIQFSCYLCRNENIFELGFVMTYDQKFYIVCGKQCLRNQKMLKLGVNPDTYQGIVIDDQINVNILRNPTNLEFEEVTVGKIRSKMEKFYPTFGIEPVKEINKLDVLKVQYSDTNEYVSCMKSFLNAERMETYLKIENVVWKGDKVVSFTCHQANDDFRRDLKNDLSFFLKENVKMRNERGKVTKKGPTYEVRFNKSSQFAGKTRGICVQLPINDITFRGSINCLSIFSDENKLSPLFQRVFLGQIDEDFLEQNKTKKQIPFYEPTGSHYPDLNKFQKEAIQRSLKYRFSMIQGPPGTGKTTVLVAIVYSLVKAGVKKVLVCAATNVAVDFATQRIAELGIKVTRVMSATYDDSGLSEAVREFASCDKSKSKDQADLEEKQSIKKADVVLTTCHIAALRLSGYEFKAILFDEAGQLSDPEIICGCVHNPSFVCLVGDHQQLGPVLKAKCSVEAKYDTVLLERLVQNGFKPSLLRIQYRMHPSISNFPSKLFYNGLLLDGVTTESRTKKNKAFNWPNKLHPIMLWNVSGKESNQSRSIYNEHEAQCIGQIIDAMYKTNTASLDQVGIITPYSAQEEYMIENLPDMCENVPPDEFNKLEIKSVDGFQGREKDFMIISFVRSNANQLVGFTTSRKRLCVSLTRAKYGIILVMNAKTFMNNEDMNQLINFYRNIHAFVEGDDINSLHEPEKASTNQNQKKHGRGAPITVKSSSSDSDTEEDIFF